MGPFPRRRACYGVAVKPQSAACTVFAETCHSGRSWSVTLPFCAGSPAHPRNLS